MNWTWLAIFGGQLLGGLALVLFSDDPTAKDLGKILMGAAAGTGTTGNIKWKPD